MDLEAVRDVDHVIAIFQEKGHWGAVAKSNFAGLRFRAPIYRTLRELALSYFESYYNLRGERTLRAYSRPVDLSRFDRFGWMTSEKSIWVVAEHLVTVRTYTALPRPAGEEPSTPGPAVISGGIDGARQALRDCTNSLFPAHYSAHLYPLLIIPCSLFPAPRARVAGKRR